MTNMKKIALIALALLALASCKENKRATLLPNVTGKAGEVIITMGDGNWADTLGTSVKEFLGGSCPFLPTIEPLYSLVQVSPSTFETSSLFKVHRNIVLFTIQPSVTEPGVVLRKDVWANPQCVIQIKARNTSEANQIFNENKAKVLAALEQAERDRVIRNAKKYEQKDIAPKVEKVFGGSLHFPTGYQLRKITDNFAWIQYDHQGCTKCILIYKYPVDPGVSEFDLDRIIAKRNEVMKANVPGMFDGTYMTTAGVEDFPPYVEYVKFQGREFAQTRGMWEVEGDFMGGPFVSESFYSKDGKDIIVTEAFLYYPNKDKRLFLRQIESILYSWYWKEDDVEK